MITRRNVIRSFSLLAASALARPSVAQTFPSKPIRIIVPAGPGGPADVTARLAAEALSGLAYPAIVENRPGAGGAIGAREAAKAPADGHTLMVANTSTLAILPLTTPNAGYNPATAFEPVAQFWNSHQVVVVPSKLPARTLAEFATLAKSQPGKLNYGHSGIGGFPHLLTELLRARLGIDMVGVAFRSDAEVMTAVLSEAVQVALPSIAVAQPMIAEGRLRALAIASPRRSPLLPDVPTAQEAGVADVDLAAFFGIAAPAGTPRAVIEQLNAACVAHFRRPETLAYLARLGVEPAIGTPAEFHAFLTRTREKWGAAIRDVGFRPH